MKRLAGKGSGGGPEYEGLFKDPTFVEGLLG